MSRNKRRVMLDDGAWHLDRKVPIALIVTILLQAAAIVAWGSNVTGELRYLREDITEMKRTNKERDDKLGGLSSLQTEVRGLKETVDRIDRRLERATLGPVRGTK